MPITTDSVVFDGFVEENIIPNSTADIIIEVTIKVCDLYFIDRVDLAFVITMNRINVVNQETTDTNPTVLLKYPIKGKFSNLGIIKINVDNSANKNGIPITFIICTAGPSDFWGSS
tara:strand:- start:4538 stop:4885 length:348 start_codon:yes stop_codon:yes gene_type:complete